MCMCVDWGLVAKWFVSWVLDHGFKAQISMVHSSFSASPVSVPTSCEWVPDISWGANYGSFLLNHSGPGGTLVPIPLAVREKVAGPPASS